MITMPMNNMLTITEAAKKLGVSRQRVHKLIATYGLKTQFAGPIKLLDSNELRKIPEVRPSGRKVS